jgi:hypothetical protein
LTSVFSLEDAEHFAPPFGHNQIINNILIKGIISFLQLSSIHAFIPDYRLRHFAPAYKIKSPYPLIPLNLCPAFIKKFNSPVFLINLVEP